MRRWSVLALVGGAVASWSLVVVDLAAAAPPSCATPPPAYAGTDAVVAAVTQENIDLDNDCAAEAAQLSAIDSDLGAFKAADHTDLSAINGTLTGWTATSPLQVTLPGSGSGSAVQVTNWPADQTVALDTASAATQSGDAEALHEDLWVLVGVIVGTFALGEVLRKVWP